MKNIRARYFLRGKEKYEMPKLRVSREWERSRILTFLSEHRGESFSGREIVDALARYMFEELAPISRGGFGVRVPKDVLEELHEQGLITRRQIQRSGIPETRYALK
jgi:hypothetical protein